MNRNKIYLVRHGENVANLLVMLSSRKVDYSLTKRGRLQAEQTGEYFKHFKVDEIYASPLKRAFETAQIIAAPHGLAVLIRENFREVYTGEFEDRPDSVESWRGWHQVTRAWADGRPETRFPGGEDHFMVCGRMRLGVEELLAGKNGRTLIIVSHIGLMTSTIAELCPAVSMVEILQKETQNCAISEVDLTLKDGRWTGELVRWGDFSHLHGDAAQFTPALMEIKG